MVLGRLINALALSPMALGPISAYFFKAYCKKPESAKNLQYCMFLEVSSKLASKRHHQNVAKFDCILLYPGPYPRNKAKSVKGCGMCVL